jgi:hypothetical protein
VHHLAVKVGAIAVALVGAVVLASKAHAAVIPPPGVLPNAPPAPPVPTPAPPAPSVAPVVTPISPTRGDIVSQLAGGVTDTFTTSGLDVLTGGMIGQSVDSSSTTLDAGGGITDLASTDSAAIDSSGGSSLFDSIFGSSDDSTTL